MWWCREQKMNLMRMAFTLAAEHWELSHELTFPPINVIGENMPNGTSGTRSLV